MFKKIFSVILLAFSIKAVATPPDFTVKSGKYQVDISGKYAYTVRGIVYDGVQAVTPSGFNNTVMAYSKGKYTGAGHTEGGKEEVLSFEVTVDGKPVTPANKAVISGKKVVLNKVSMLDKLKVFTELVVTPEEICENKHYEATDEQPVHLMYVYLYCWNKASSGWIAKTEDGKMEEGLFDGKFDSKTRWHLGNNVKWAAVLFKPQKKGILMYFPELIKGKTRKSSFWEVKGAYNKYYLMLNTPRSYEKGYKSPEYKMIIKGFGITSDKINTDIEKTVSGIEKNSEAAPPKSSKPKKKKSLGGYMTFSVDYTESMDSANAQKAQGEAEAKIINGSKLKFDFDTMAHSNRGLMVGEGCPSVVYSAEDNLNDSQGSLEMVIKAEDYPWNDQKVHIFAQSVNSGGTEAKFYVYKYKTSGLAVYFEPDRSGKKAFLNQSVKNWKDKSWHHLVFNWSKRHVTLYVDGVLSKNLFMETDIKWPKKFCVGPLSTKWGRNGKSTISSLTLFNRPLRDYEVTGLAKERLPNLKIEANTYGADRAIGRKSTLKASPWFSTKPRLGLDSLKDDAVLPPWTSIKRQGGIFEVWNRKYDLTGSGIFSNMTSGSQKLLDSPVEFMIDTNGYKGALTFNAPKVITADKGRVIVERKAKVFGGMKAALRYMIEFDGMVWCTLTIEPNGKPVNKLTLDVPVNAHTAKFIHYVGAPLKYESQDLVKNSYSRELGLKPGILFKSPQKTNVWLGDNERGLLWFAESDQYWYPKDRDDYIIVKRSSDNKVNMALHMITKPLPVKKDMKLEIKFGFMATPVKPLPKSWRGMTFSAQYDSFKNETRGSTLIYWPNEWRAMMLDPEPYRAVNPNKTKDKVNADRKTGRKIVPYWTRLHYVSKDKNKINPDADKVHDTWATEPNRPGGGSHQVFRAACTSPWQDYLVWCTDSWAKIMGHIDGVYIDETQPIPNTKAASGGGYTDVDGKRRATFEIFGSRDLIKRINWNIWKRNKGQAPFSIAHCSATHTMPTLSMYGAMLIGEQYYSGYFKGRNPELLPPNDTERLYYYSYALPMDRLRAECYWKQWGAVMVWLPCLKDQKELMKNPIPTRDMLSRIMQADMLVWPLFCDSREVWKTWKFRKEFGIADPAVTFTPYWENQVIVPDRKDVVAGYYKHGSKYLVLVSNLNRQAEKATLTLKGIDVKSVKNAETLKPIPFVNGKITLDMKRNDYIALRINY